MDPEVAAAADADNSSDCEHLVKVIFVGDAGVGKSSLLERLFSNKFDPFTKPTIGCDFKTKAYTIDGRRIRMTLWDTAGAERFAALTANYFRGAHGIVLVYDVTRPETLEGLRNRWMPEVQAHALSSCPDIVRLVVGNKVDMEVERKVGPETGAAFAKAHNCMYSETSAKLQEGDNVHDALVWGLLVNIVDNERLLRAYGYDKLELEQGGEQQHKRKNGCCS